MQTDLTPFECFQLKTYGNLLPNIQQSEDAEPEDGRTRLEDNFIFELENPQDNER